MNANNQTKLYTYKLFAIVINYNTTAGSKEITDMFKLGCYDLLIGNW